MAGLVPAIHDLLPTTVIMDPRDKPGDDEIGGIRQGLADKVL